MKIGLITDIHEQVHSLERALLTAAGLGCNEMACLGDITGYDPLFFAEEPGRSASECIRLIRQNCRWVVAGNHDRQVRAENPGLPEEDIAWLDALPDSLTIHQDNHRVMISHYIFPDLTGSSMEFVRRQHQLAALHELFINEKLSLAFAGHDHPVGVGFGYPAPGRWRDRFTRAIHYMPFNRFHLDGQKMICLLPALATLTSRPGLAVWDSRDNILDIIQINHKP